MDSIHFVIDSKDKNKLSKGGKLFHYCFGSFLIFIGLLCYIKAWGHKNELLIFYVIIVVSGITWIIKGLVGKQFIISSERYIKIQDEKLFLKSADKKEMVYSADSIKAIKISASQIDIGIKDNVTRYNLKWITHAEYQALKDKLTLFCAHHKIEIA